jgi:hypothetical protein
MSTEATPTEDKRKLIGPLGIIVGLVITAGFFLYIWNVSYHHTPDFSERGRVISAAYTAVSMTIIFWIGLMGFWVTLVDQVRRKKAGIKS